MNKFSVSLGQYDFNNTSNLSRLVLKKGGFTPMLDNHKRGILPLKRAFLGESQRVVRWLSNQTSSFRMETDFDLGATNIYVTL